MRKKNVPKNITKRSVVILCVNSCCQSIYNIVQVVHFTLHLAQAILKNALDFFSVDKGLFFIDVEVVA